tara:strand:- start:1901 stop:3400 length:1500 start_codon:yes stop_codon:yes gene_type:complete
MTKINKTATLLAVLIVLGDILPAQIKRDPRMVSLGGAYTVLADGIYAVGVNPANLSYQHDKPFMWQMFTLNYGLLNNFFSLENYTKYNGANLERENEKLKTEFFNEIGDGLRFTMDSHMALPALNYTAGNMAFTSDFVMIGDIKIPKDMFHLILKGNPLNRPLDLTLGYEVMGLTEYGFSFAVPYDKFSWGATIKFLQGFFYLGIDEEESLANIVTDTTAFYGSVRYLLRQGIGGSGYGLDLGFTFKEFDGWRVGFSLINAVGRIYWNRPSITKDLLGVDGNKGIFSYKGQDVIDGASILYVGSIDSVSGTKLENIEFSELFIDDTNGVVIQVVLDSDESITLPNGQVVEPDETVIIKLEDWKNIPENDKEKFKTGEKFSIRYPAIFRFGVSKQVDKDFLVAADLVAGFQDRLFVQKQWKLSMGLKFTRFPGFPLRIGFSWGGRYSKELGMGFGVYKGPVMFDFALSLRNGLWIHTMKGIGISMSLSLTGLKGRGDDNE